jgi:hypothetical protein
MKRISDDIDFACTPVLLPWGSSMTASSHAMKHPFKIGDALRWNSDAGHVTGKVTKVHVSDCQFMGRTRRCSEDEPQYEVKSDKTGALAMHKADALSKQG